MAEAFLSEGAIRPMGHRVIVKPLQKEKQERGGLIKGKTTENGKVLPNGVKVGERILYGIFRQFFKKFDGMAICVLTCFIAVILFVSSSPQDTAALERCAEPVYEVVSPIGERTIKMTAMVPRLDTLAGKTVCMVWNNAFKADVTLSTIGETLKKQYPGVKIVPYTEMPEAFLPEPPGAPREQSEALQAVFKEKGCNAVISGNGG
jgi:co-chaperonin GroES (HSP10)